MHFCKQHTYTNEEFENSYIIHEYKKVVFAVHKTGVNYMHDLHALIKNVDGDWYWLYIGSSFSVDNPIYAIHSYVCHKTGEKTIVLDKVIQELDALRKVK